ncbi:MAG TPA: GNAT family N-acetyltransferase [Herpetosiphonaceae bacterium]
MLKLRPATAADQPVITQMIAEADLNPRGLEWPRFLVVADGEEVVGIGQIKRHSDGTSELASLAVRPAYQDRGIGYALMAALLAREPGRLHLMCANNMEPYYQRYGFRSLRFAEYPRYFKRLYPLLLGMTALARLRGWRGHVLVMRRDGGTAAPR